MRRRTSAVPSVFMILALALAASGGFWFWQRANSPEPAVRAFGEAVKRKDWPAVYHDIAWQDTEARIDESTFVNLAKVASTVFSLEDFQVGTPTVQGDTATVPVDVKARVSTLMESGIRESHVDVKCRRIDGQWKIVPQSRDDFLGLGKIGLLSAGH